ncbi:MAG: hypothetical protein EOP09_12005 [Proteobacteria bacterium]|nr:MAG: hypothetical protein EOP09_12005 [Pseudomonadota bacterium]
MTQSFRSLMLGIAASFSILLSAQADIDKLPALRCSPLVGETAYFNSFELTGHPASAGSKFPEIVIDGYRPSQANLKMNWSVSTSTSTVVNASKMELIGHNSFQIAYHFDSQSSSPVSVLLYPTGDTYFIFKGKIQWPSPHPGAPPAPEVDVECDRLADHFPMPGPGMGGHN